MSSRHREAATLKMLVQSSTRFHSETQRDAVADELTQFMNSGRLSPLNRRRLLQFVHVARALETTLLGSCQSRGLPLPAKPSMVAYLNQLVGCTPAALPQAVRDNCKVRVADVRNQLAHAAGAYPQGELQLASGFDAARTCLALLLS